MNKKRKREREDWEVEKRGGKEEGGEGRGKGRYTSR